MPFTANRFSMNMYHASAASVNAYSCCADFSADHVKKVFLDVIVMASVLISVLLSRKLVLLALPALFPVIVLLADSVPISPITTAPPACIN